MNISEYLMEHEGDRCTRPADGFEEEQTTTLDAISKQVDELRLSTNLDTWEVMEKLNDLWENIGILDWYNLPFAEAFYTLVDWKYEVLDKLPKEMTAFFNLTMNATVKDVRRIFYWADEHCGNSTFFRDYVIDPLEKMLLELNVSITWRDYDNMDTLTIRHLISERLSECFDELEYHIDVANSTKYFKVIKESETQYFNCYSDALTYYNVHGGDLYVKWLSRDEWSLTRKKNKT